MEKIVKNYKCSNIFIKKQKQRAKLENLKTITKVIIFTVYYHKLIQKLTSLHLLHPLHVFCKAASWFEESDNSVDGAERLIT